MNPVLRNYGWVRCRLDGRGVLAAAGNVGACKRLLGETIERLVAEYVAGTTLLSLGRRYRIAKNSVLRLVRQVGERARHPR